MVIMRITDDNRYAECKVYDRKGKEIIINIAHIQSFRDIINKLEHSDVLYFQSIRALVNYADILRFRRVIPKVVAKYTVIQCKGAIQTHKYNVAIDYYATSRIKGNRYLHRLPKYINSLKNKTKYDDEVYKFN